MQTSLKQDINFAKKYKIFNFFLKIFFYIKNNVYLCDIKNNDININKHFKLKLGNNNELRKEI